MLSWIIIGLVAGLVARWVVRAESRGCLFTCVVGILGALLGGALMNATGREGVIEFELRSFLVAAVGAVLLLLILEALGGRRKA